MLLILWVIVGGNFLIKHYMTKEAERAGVQRELEKDITARAERKIE